MVADDGKPPHCKRHKGRWYWEPPKRLRAQGVAARPLGGDQAAAWAYARKLNAELLEDPAAPPPGSVAWLFARFFASERFAALAPSTQADYRSLARALTAVPIADVAFGQVPARSVRPKHADALYARLRETRGPAAAHYACRFARRVWHWAARREHVDAAAPNPWAGMELPGLPKRTARWTAAQVAAFRAKAAELERPSIGLAVLAAYCLSHRQGDVLRLTWGEIDAGERRTAKTGAVVPLDVTAYPELAAELAAERARRAASPLPSVYVFVCETTGRPWQADYFRHEFRRIATDAGTPKDLQFRDLRATALTELADAGADIIDLSTHSAHQTVEMARRYSRRTLTQFRRAAAKRLAAKERN